MQFLYIAAAYLRSESKHNYKVNIASVAYPWKSQFCSKTELQRSLVTSLKLRVIR